MKHLLIAVYFIVVMLVSGLSQAQQIPSVVASVTYAQFNLSQEQILIQGNLSTPCQKLPQVEIASVDHSNRTVQLLVLSEPTADICIQVLGGSFDIMFDIQKLGLETGIEYKLTINKDEQLAPIKVSTKQEANILPISGKTQISINGKVFQTANGLMLKSGRGYFKLASDVIALEQYAGKTVSVVGQQIHLGIALVSNGTNKFDGLPKSLLVAGISSN